jgi:hypothetical protein
MDNKQLLKARRMAMRVRAAVACKACKQKKTKCGDSRPCSKCKASRNSDCVDGSDVTVAQGTQGLVYFAPNSVDHWLHKSRPNNHPIILQDDGLSKKVQSCQTGLIDESLQLPTSQNSPPYIPQSVHKCFSVVSNLDFQSFQQNAESQNFPPSRFRDNSVQPATIGPLPQEGTYNRDIRWVISKASKSSHLCKLHPNWDTESHDTLSDTTPLLRGTSSIPDPAWASLHAREELDTGGRSSVNAIAASDSQIAALWVEQGLHQRSHSEPQPAADGMTAPGAGWEGSDSAGWWHTSALIRLQPEGQQHRSAWASSSWEAQASRARDVRSCSPPDHGPPAPGSRTANADDFRKDSNAQQVVDTRDVVFDPCCTGEWELPPPSHALRRSVQGGDIGGRDGGGGGDPFHDDYRYWQCTKR